MKKLLVVVDYQNDFVNGSLGFEGAEKLEECIAKKIKEYKDYDIVYTLDTHSDNYFDTMEGKKLPVKHCIKGSEGWNVYGKIKRMLKNYKCFKKDTFGSKDLFDYLRTKDYEIVELAGLVSNICIVSNAVIAKTALPQAEVIVDATCTDSFDKKLNEKSLDVMEGLHINVIGR